MEAYCLPVSQVVRTTAPTLEQEPVTLAEARRQCGIAGDNGYYDPDLARLIAAAREAVESDTGLVCYTGEHKYKLTYWPDETWFDIPVRPITAVGSITYIDGSGTTQTWSSANYVAPDQFSVKPVVRLAYNATWPAVRGDENGIVITFTAGYASVVAMPKTIKTLALLKLHALYLDQHSEDSKQQYTSYERMLNQSGIRRPTYP